jgi:DNA repair exonuclease SbcCD ATPase subunit
MDVHVQYQAWAAEMSSMYYTEMRDRMEDAKEIHELVKELMQIKGELKKAGGGTMGYGAKAKELEDFLEAHKDHPLYQELKALIEPMIGALKQWEAEFQAGPKDIDKFKEERNAQLSGMEEQIQGLIDGLQKDEQLEQLLITDLHKKGLAAIDFASNAQRNAHTTLANIIGNMRA